MNDQGGTYLVPFRWEKEGGLDGYGQRYVTFTQRPSAKDVDDMLDQIADSGGFKSVVVLGLFPLSGPLDGDEKP
jgi:cobalamin-dependent methionine synthase I